MRGALTRALAATALLGACDVAPLTPLPCHRITCSGNGVCVETDAGPACVCDEGFVHDGLHCLDPCEGVTCSDVGRCVRAKGEALCECDPGFLADEARCLDPCEGVSCSGAGFCVRGDGKASCDCLPGFVAEGLTCRNPCTGVACSGHGTCEVVDGEPSCSCFPEFVADGLACVGCDDEACSGHGECALTPEGALCTCDPGWIADGIDCVLDPLCDPARVAVEGTVQDLAAFGTQVYVASDDAFVAIDADSLEVTEIGVDATYTSAIVPGTAGDGPFAYVAGLEIIRVWNLTDGFSDEGAHPYAGVGSIAWAGDFLYVSTRIGGFRTLDVSVRGAPSFVGGIEFGTLLRTVAVVDDWAYVVLDSDLGIVDVSDPAAPVRLADFPLAGTTADVSRSGDLLFVAAFEAGVHVVDISDRDAPLLVDSVDLPGPARGAAAWADGFVAAIGDEGVAYVDASDGSWSERGVLHLSDAATEIVPVGETLAAVDLGSAVAILNLRCPALGAP